MSFHPATPVLPVGDLAASIAYYVDVLGFHLKWETPGVFACVARDHCTLFLCKGDQGHAGTWVWIGVADADATCAELTAKGAKIRNPPTNYAWALEMQVEDPDGNVLRMGSEAKAGVPSGDWLDMNGVKWVPKPGGGWTRVE